jgi:hypothetical protein
MSSKKLFSKLLAKSLLITSVVSCFSCSFVFAMEDVMKEDLKGEEKSYRNMLVSMWGRAARKTIEKKYPNIAKIEDVKEYQKELMKIFNNGYVESVENYMRDNFAIDEPDYAKYTDDALKLLGSANGKNDKLEFLKRCIVESLPQVYIECYVPAEVLDDIRKAVKSVINDLKKQRPLENTLNVRPKSSVSIYRLAFINGGALKSQVLRLLRSNIGLKYKKSADAILYLNQKGALDLLGKIAEECQDQLKQNSAK